MAHICWASPSGKASPFCFEWVYQSPPYQKPLATRMGENTIALCHPVNLCHGLLNLVRVKGLKHPTLHFNHQVGDVGQDPKPPVAVDYLSLHFRYPPSTFDYEGNSTPMSTIFFSLNCSQMQPDQWLHPSVTKRSRLSSNSAFPPPKMEPYQTLDSETLGTLGGSSRTLAAKSFLRLPVLSNQEIPS